MIDYTELLSRSERISEPVFKGEWATVIFRPDLGSQQEFIVGIIVSINGDNAPYVKWLPSFSKLSSLYGDAISHNDTRDLVSGSERAILGSFSKSIDEINSGSLHVKVVRCGYIATNDIQKELTARLKRQAGALWPEASFRENPMDDEWAYLAMKRSIVAFDGKIFLPQRRVAVASKSFNVQLDNGKSFGSILSARYSSFTTVEKHIGASLRQVLGAHRATQRSAPPALFVVLPDSETPNEPLMVQKTKRLLSEIEDAGVLSISDPNPEHLAKELEKWALASPS